jgi:hypothetical protein
MALIILNIIALTNNCNFDENKRNVCILNYRHENISGVSWVGVGWNEGAGGYEGVLYSHVRGANIRIRSRVSGDPAAPELIRSHFLQEISKVRS